MSDVPVTTWWLLAWVLAISPFQWTQLGAGLAVSAAVLTRPNLVPLAIVLAAVVAANRPRLPRLALFAAGSIPGCLLVGAINAHLYGSPLASGYGPLEAFYEWDRWPANLRRYAGWLIDLNSHGLLLAFLAPLVTRVRFALAMLAFFFLLLACYLFYLVFDTWPFLRFLLPGLPLLFVLASAVVVHGLERLPVALRSTAVLLVCTLLPYLLLEGWEIPLFRNYLGGVSQYGAVDWPATLEYRDLARVNLCRLADRAQHRAGAAIVTSRITYRR